METIITKEYLREHPNHIFVFGDNLSRQGKGGAAALRDEPNIYGFITKIAPDNFDGSFYRPNLYRSIFVVEVRNLIQEIYRNPNKIYLISKLGSGLANKYNIWEEIIESGLKILENYKPQVIFLWED